jgi:hypothetical protein
MYQPTNVGIKHVSVRVADDHSNGNGHLRTTFGQLELLATKMGYEMFRGGKEQVGYWGMGCVVFP